MPDGPADTAPPSDSPPPEQPPQNARRAPHTVPGQKPRTATPAARASDGAAPTPPASPTLGPTEEPEPAPAPRTDVTPGESPPDADGPPEPSSPDLDQAPDTTEGSASGVTSDSASVPTGDAPPGAADGSIPGAARDSASAAADASPATAADPASDAAEDATSDASSRPSTSAAARRINPSATARRISPSAAARGTRLSGRGHRPGSAAAERRPRGRPRGSRPSAAARRITAKPTAGHPSWFQTGFGLALGAILAWLLVQTVLKLSELLTLLLLSVFIAVSLEPVVAWLGRLGLRRGWSVAAVVAAFAGLLAGFLALIIPPVTDAVNALSDGIPRWRQQLHDHHSALGRLEDHYHVLEKAQSALGSGGASQVAGGVLGAGQLVISLVTSAVIVVTVTLYVMAGLPTIKQFCFRFVPGSRRPRVEAITEEILSRVGRYMLGNIVTSAIAGLATFIWCEVVGVPYAAALGFFVALMDMVPVVGSTIGGVVVSLVALIVSFPVALITAAFYIGFRVAEDYLIMPRAMKFAVDVHPVVTVVAVLAGGSLLGVIGGLVAIPAAVALGIVLDEYVFPRTDAS